MAPSVGVEAPRAAEPTTPGDRNIAVGSRGLNTFPRLPLQLPDALTLR